MADPPRRRLPVLQQPSPTAPSDGGDEERPPWHWVGFGVVAIFATWLPLAYAAQSLGARIAASRFGTLGPEELAARVASLSEAERGRLGAWLALPHALALALAAFAGGWLVGRFGGRTTVREAASAGVGAALVAVALSVRDAGLSWTSLLTLLVATAGSAAGGAVGVKLRRTRGAPT